MQAEEHMNALHTSLVHSIITQAILFIKYNFDFNMQLRLYITQF